MRRLLHIAAFWMILTGLLSVIIAVIAKNFGDTFHPFQIMFFYCSFGALCLLPAMVVHYGCNKNPLHLRSVKWRYHLTRAICEFSAFSLMFYSIMQLPLPMQTAIGYTTPIFASLFAMLFVKETITMRIAMSLLLGMIGIAIIHNPFVMEFSSAQSLGVAAAIGAAILFGICGSMIKLATFTAPPLMIAMIMLVITSIIAAPFAISVWHSPEAEHLGMLWLFGLCVAAVQYCISRALHLGMITRLMPLTYLNLVWASLFAYFLFDELISERTIYGSIFIFGAVLFVSMKRKKRVDATS